MDKAEEERLYQAWLAEQEKRYDFWSGCFVMGIFVAMLLTLAVSVI